MSDIIGALIAILISLVVGLGISHFETKVTINQSQQLLAEKVASQYTEFANALNAYVNADFNSNIMGIVNCSTLQSDNYLSPSFSCTDPLGEELQGDISEPWGFPQSWVVYPASPPNSSELEKYGIDSELQWEAFTYLVSQYSEDENSSMKAFSINNGAFTQLDSNVPDNIVNYFSADSGEFSQTDPSISYYDNYSFFISPNMQKEPSYWLFGVSSYNAANTADIDYQNLGYSSVCPVGGLTPGVMPSSDDFMVGNLRGSYSSSYVNYTDPSYAYLSDYNYLCIPAPKSIINNTSTIFTNSNYSGGGNYYGNQMATNGSSYNGSSDAEDENTANQVIPQNYQVYYLNVGALAKYTFIVTEGFYNTHSTAGGGGWGYYSGLAFWDGQPNYDNIGIESTPLVNSNGLYPAAPIWPVTDMQPSPITINLG